MPKRVMRHGGPGRSLGAALNGVKPMAAAQFPPRNIHCQFI
jgi:hypothetical protein